MRIPLNTEWRGDAQHTIEAGLAQCPLSAWESALRVSVFSPPPLKFRTVGFPQYGFKREFDRDLRPPGVARAVTPRQLIRGLSSYLRRELQAVAGLSPKRHSPLLTERSRPEVLGSPAGSIVPPGQRLL